MSFKRKVNEMNALRLICCLAILGLVGCSQSNEAIIPEGELTPEQVAAVKAEDAAIEDEESQGKVQNGKAVK